MKELRKKSVDAAVNQAMVKACREQIELTWDRAEAMQPQCGFGRMAICCTDCLEGPCRVNPFAENGQKTICGRDQQALVANHFLRQTADGAAALAGLAEQFGCELDASTWRSISLTADRMISCGKCFDELGQTVVTILTALAGTPASKRRTLAAGMGVLEAGKPNIVCHGHVPPAKVEALLKAAGSGANVVSICGSERTLPVVTNYVSQETPLLTGLVDLLVVGSQCVTPALIALAEKLSVPVTAAATLSDEAGFEQAVAIARNSFQRRAGKRGSFVTEMKQNYVGYDELAISKGLVYLGGCGNVANTQDASFLKAASFLIEKGFTVVTAGCAGTALAKAGMCNSTSLINLGSCHDAGEFLELAARAKAAGFPVFAVLPELTHNKTLATAVGYASRAIPTWVNLGEMSLPAELLGGNLRAFAGVAQLPQALAEVVAGK
jgi:hydroxylamine reductase (hybrid-cluster protein)